MGTGASVESRNENKMSVTATSIGNVSEEIPITDPKYSIDFQGERPDDFDDETIDTAANTTKPTSADDDHGGEEKSRTVVSTSLLKMTLKKCLHQLPVSDVYDTDIENIVDNITIKVYDEDSDVLLKGSESQGIYIVLEGQVNVMSSNGQDIFAILDTGDYFGEVSTIYGIPCTARVKTASKCRLGLINKDKVENLLIDPVVDIMDWFVKRRYLPTTEDLDPQRTQRRMALTYLKQTTLVRDWSAEAIKSLVKQITPSMVVVYPPNSCIMMVDDPPSVVNVVIRGRVEIRDRNDDIIMEIDTKESPFLIGEDRLHLQVTADITVIAVTTCHIISITEEQIYNVLDQFPEDAGIAWSRRKKTWQTFAEKVNTAPQINRSHLHPEVIFEMLKKCNILSPRSCVPDVAVTGVPQVYKTGDIICKPKESEKMMLLVLKGEIDLVTKKSGNQTLVEGELFNGSVKKTKQKKAYLAAKSDCLIWKMNISDIQKV